MKKEDMFRSVCFTLLFALIVFASENVHALQQRETAANSQIAKAPVIPDVEVVTQAGEKVHFYSDLVRNKAVAINFIFTTCTTVCPPLTANFARVQKAMLSRGKDLKLISISVDPENDTPERLKAYAELFRAKPGWTFVTGRRSDLERIWKAFNIYLASKQDHSPTVAIGNDATHVWAYVSGLSTASKLVAAIDPILAAATDAQPEIYDQASGTKSR